jgi:hypothetical protein
MLVRLLRNRQIVLTVDHRFALSNRNDPATCMASSPDAWD